MDSNVGKRKSSEVRLSMRVSEEEKQLIREAADDYGLTVTEFVMRAVKYIKQHNPKLVISPKANSLAGIAN